MFICLQSWLWTIFDIVDNNSFLLLQILFAIMILEKSKSLSIIS